jgi:hypothetical protein
MVIDKHWTTHKKLYDAAWSVSLKLGEEGVMILEQLSST